MNDLLESRFTRKPFEKVLLVLDGRSVMSIVSNGLDTRQDDWDFDTNDKAETYYNESIVKVLVEGFKEDG